MILSLSLWLFQIKNNHCSFQKVSLHINIWKYLLQNLTVFQSGSGNQTFSDFSLRIFPKWKRNEFVIVLSRRWRCLDQLSWKQNQRSCKQQKKLKHFSLRSILLNVNYFLLKCRSLSLELVVWLTSLVSVKFWCSLCSDRWRLWVWGQKHQRGVLKDAGSSQKILQGNVVNPSFCACSSQRSPHLF